MFTASCGCGERPKPLLEQLEGLDSQALERMAGRDFQAGGRYGNAIAKQMAVQLNPYSKMCGEIVKEALLPDLKDSMPQDLQ